MSSMIYSGSTRKAIGTSFGNGILSQSSYLRNKKYAEETDTYTAGGLGCVPLGSTCRISHVDRKVVKPIDRETSSGSNN
jgi:hypothetical protein